MGKVQKERSGPAPRNFLMLMANSNWYLRETVANLQGLAALVRSQTEVKKDPVGPVELGRAGDLLWNVLEEINEHLDGLDSEIEQEKKRERKIIESFHKSAGEKD